MLVGLGLVGYFAGANATRPSDSCDTDTKDKHSWRIPLGQGKYRLLRHQPDKGRESDFLMSSLANDLLNPSTLPGLVSWGAIFFLAATSIVVLIRRTARRIAAHLTDVTAVRFVSALAQVLTYLVAFVLYAHLVPELRTIGTALLAGVSVASVVVGLAAQNTLGNLVAGLSLVLYRPFSVGDRIQLNSPIGVIRATVETISLGYTMLRADEGQEVIVPNTIMVTSTVIRLSNHKVLASDSSEKSAESVPEQ